MPVLLASLAGRLAEVAALPDFYTQYGVAFVPLGEDEEVFLALGRPDGTHVEPRRVLACAAWWARQFGWRYMPDRLWVPRFEMAWARFVSESWGWSWSRVPAGARGAVPVTLVHNMPGSLWLAAPSRCPLCRRVCGVAVPGCGGLTHVCERAGCGAVWPAVDRPIESVA